VVSSSSKKKQPKNKSFDLILAEQKSLNLLVGAFFCLQTYFVWLY